MDLLRRQSSRNVLRLAVLAAILAALWICFPNDRIAVCVIGAAFLFEMSFDDALLQILPWAVLGAVAAWYANELAIYLLKLQLSYLQALGVRLLCVLAFGGSLMFTAARIPIWSRRFLFLSCLTAACGLIAFAASHQPDRRIADGDSVRSWISSGCSLGTIVGSVAVIAWTSLRVSPNSVSRGFTSSNEM